MILPIMKFREGNTVEVLRTKLDPCGSWFPGRIVEFKGDQCTVRYDLLLNHEGEPIVEKVREDDVRPQPPSVRKERWVNGDVAEVFDTHSWRFGKVAKVMNDKRFVIRLFGSICLREFSRSDLRVQQVWRNKKWVRIGKGGGDKQINNNVGQNFSKYSRGLFLYGDPQQGIQEETHSKERTWQGHVKTLSPMKTLKRYCDFHFKSSLADAAVARVHKRGKATTKEGKHDQLSVGDLPIVDQVTEESNKCSVTSCSSNNIGEYTVQNSQKAPLIISGSLSNDVGSSCATRTRRKDLPTWAEEELEADIHKLELDAYKSTVQALYCSGPLSWEQESLLTNLRLSLHISNEEHLLQLRQLLSSQVP